MTYGQTFNGKYYHTPLKSDEEVETTKSTCQSCLKRGGSKWEKTEELVECNCFDDEGNALRKNTCLPIVEKYGHIHYQIWGIRPGEDYLDLLADGVDTEDEMDCECRSFISQGEPINNYVDAYFWRNFLKLKDYKSLKIVRVNLLKERDLYKFYLETGQILNHHLDSKRAKEILF
tara:strand:+ start:3450 stop:3974 length:525 start_codon:yes stop_codon:yes gene_type:complete